jgi:hypothetical protein
MAEEHFPLFVDTSFVSTQVILGSKPVNIGAIWKIASMLSFVSLQMFPETYREVSTNPSIPFRFQYSRQETFLVKWLSITISERAREGPMYLCLFSVFDFPVAGIFDVLCGPGAIIALRMRKRFKWRDGRSRVELTYGFVGISSRCNPITIGCWLAFVHRCPPSTADWWNGWLRYVSFPAKCRVGQSFEVKQICCVTQTWVWYFCASGGVFKEILLVELEVTFTKVKVCLVSLDQLRFSMYNS